MGKEGRVLNQRTKHSRVQITAVRCFPSFGSPTSSRIWGQRVLIKSGAFPNFSLRVHYFFYHFYYNFFYNFFFHFYYNYYCKQFPQMEQVALLLQPAAPSPRNPAGTVITPLRPKPLMITITVVTISISFCTCHHD